MHEANSKFTPAQGAEFKHAGLMLLRSWAILAQLAALRGRRQFPVKPKHHMLEHAVRIARVGIACCGGLYYLKVWQVWLRVIV